MTAAKELETTPSFGCVGPGLGFMRVERSTRLYRGIKPHYATSLMYAGHSAWWVDGHTGVQTPGTLQLKEPGQVHHDLRRDLPSTLQVLSFDAALIDEARDALNIARRARLATLQLAPRDPSGAALHRLHQLAFENAPAFAFESAIAEAATAFAAQLGPPGRSDDRFRPNVRRARDFLLKHLTEPVTLEAMAEHARMDKFHLCRAFTAEVGLPPYAFLTHARIAEACVLLHRGVRPSEIASQVGFCDQSQMHRHFVRIVGLTPGEYKKRAAA